MGRRTTRTALGVALGVAVLLGGCGDDDEEAGSSDTAGGATERTTTTPDDTVDETEETMNSFEGVGEPVDSAALACDDLTASVEAAYATTVASMEDMGGICTATLADAGGTVSILWNTYAPDEASFDTLASDTTAVEVAGASAAVSKVDDVAASVYALVDGQGTWQVDYAPDYVSGELPAADDVPTVVALAELLVAG